MIVYAVMAAMSFQNSNRRDSAYDFVVNRLATEQMWGEPQVLKTDKLSSHDPVTPSLYCRFNFLDATARDTFYSDLTTLMRGAAGPNVGSWISKHDCGDYEVPPVPCVESDRVTF